MTVLAEVTDPDGRRVELRQEDWDHITEGHPEMSGLQAEVLRAIKAPDRRRVGHEPNEKWYYLGGVGPSSWIKTVVVLRPKTDGSSLHFPVAPSHDSPDRKPHL